MQISGLPVAPTYFYRLRAVVGAVSSEYSNVITVNVIPPAPVALDPSDVSPNGFTARWEAARGADNYRFDLASDSAFRNMIQADITVTALKRLVNVNNPALAYYYRVRSQNVRGVSANSNVIAVFLRLPFLWHCAEKAATIRCKSHWRGMLHSRRVSLSAMWWNWRLTAISAVRKVGGRAGQRYFARVKALHDRGESAYSSTISFVLPPAVPSNVRLADVTENGFEVSWQSVQGAVSYRIEINGNVVRTVEGTSAVITGLQSLQRQSVRISATNEGGNSDWSDAALTTTLPLPTTANPSPNIEPRRFTAAWNPSAQSNIYILEVSGNEGFTSLLAGYPRTINDATEAVVDLPTAGGVYFYRVRVSATAAGQNLVSRPSAAQRVSILTTPAGLRTENVTATGFDLRWNMVTDAQNYEAQLSINNFSTVLRETNVIGTSVSFTGLEANREYQVRVRALASPRSVSEWAASQQFTLPAPPQEVSMRRISARRATEIAWSYERLPFERVSNLRFVVERSDNVGVPFRAVSNEIALPATHQFVFEDVTGTQRLQASYRLRISNAAGPIFYDMGQRIVTSSEETEAAPVVTDCQIFPNPAQETLYIRSDKPLRNAWVQIADAKGATVYKGQLSTAAVSAQLSVAHLPAGWYVLQIVSDTHTQAFKWAKE